MTLPDATATHLDGKSPLLRREDDALLRGKGQFVHNFNEPNTLHGLFLRGEAAQVEFELRALDRARAVPGICAILTAAELGEHAMPSINPLLPISKDITFPTLPRDCITYVGQPLAIIVGHTLRSCQAALRQIQVIYGQARSSTDSRPVTNIEIDSSHDVSPQSASEPSNSTNAPVNVKTRLSSARVISASLEPRAVVAKWHEASNSIEVLMGTQSPSRARADIAAALGLSVQQVRVISTDVGGAFGAKASVYPEDLVVALAAQRVRGTVKWTSSRSEEFVSAMQGRGSDMSAELSIDQNGQLQSLSAKLDFDLGAWLPFSGVVPLRNAARILPGPYTLKNVQVQGQGRRTPRAPVNIYRGAGRPEATLLVETLIDGAARKLKMDPVQLRLLNLVQPEQMPWSTASGESLDSGDYPALLQLACDAFDYSQERSLQAQRRQAGQCVGIGLAFYIEPCGQGWESAEVTLREDGSVLVASGSPAQGQGHLTTYARIAAQTLGCDERQVTVVIGDTAQCPEGIGTLASRSTAIGGSAIVTACEQLKWRISQGESLPLSESCRFTANEAWSAGCMFVRVLIDLDTGAPEVERMVWADDAGHIICPELAKGQLIGGAAQGLGQALMEAIRYDNEQQMQTGSFMDYAIARAADMPDIEIVSIQTPSPNNPLGAKGVGEAGCIGVPAAIMNAVRDAISYVRPDLEPELSLPLSAEQIWRAVHFPCSPSTNISSNGLSS